MKNYFLTIIFPSLIFQPVFLLAQTVVSENAFYPCDPDKQKLIKIIGDNLYIQRYTMSHSLPENENGIWTIKARLINGTENLEPEKKIILQKVGQEIIDEEINFSIQHQLTLFLKEQFPKIKKALESDSADSLKKAKKSVIGVGVEPFFASGVIIDKNQIASGEFKYLVVTADHVLDNAGWRVILPLPMKDIKTKIIKRDSKHDQALLEFTADIDLPKVQLADLEKLPMLLLGTRAVSIGYPHNKSRAFEPRVSPGTALSNSSFTCPTFSEIGRAHV